MSGNSGGGYDPVPADDCTQLITQSTISAPDPEVLKKVSKGDLLKLSLRSERGPVEAYVGKDLLGSLYTKAALVECMNAGHKFKGEVIEKQGGKVVLQVSSR